VRVLSDSLMKRPLATLTRPRPWAYLVPPEAVGAVGLLLDHRILVERLDEPVEAVVHAYTLGDFSYETAYNHAAAVKLEVEETVTLPVTLPAGTYVVRTAQIQGRVAAHLLEPETRDGVVYWNRMDAWLPKPAIAAYREGSANAPHFPIYKLMSPLPLVTTLVQQDAREALTGSAVRSGPRAGRGLWSPVERGPVVRPPPRDFARSGPGGPDPDP